MGRSKHSDAVKRDAAHQIPVRGSPVRGVPRRLGGRKYSLNKWPKLFGEPSPTPGSDHKARTRRQRRELAGVTKARDIVN